MYFARTYPTTVRSPTRSLPTPSATTTTTAPSQTSSQPSSQPSSQTNVGAIGGGVVGGFVFLAVVGLVVWLCLRRRRKRTQPSAAVVPQASPMTEQHAAGSPNTLHKWHAASPSYSSTQGSPPNRFTADHWPPMQGPQQQPTNRQPQQYYPPPPQAQQYYPPPSAPQHQDPPSPIAEMPSFRSPVNAADPPARAL